MEQSVVEEFLREGFGFTFQKYELERWLRPIREFLAGHKTFLLERKINPKVLDFKKKNPPKEQLIAMACIPFVNKEIFDKFRNALPEEVRTVLDVLVWEDSLHQKEIEARLGIAIDTEVVRRGYGGREQKFRELKPGFEFLNVGHFYSWTAYQGFTLELAPFIRRVVIDYYDPPKGKNLEPLAEIKKTDYLYTTGERDILLEIPRLLAYYHQGQIKTTTKGKPQQSTLAKMQRKLNLQEFYPEAPDKELRLMRTNLLAGLLMTPHLEKKENAPPAFIKSLFQQSYPEYYFSFSCLITYLKGAGYIQPDDVLNVEVTFHHILTNLPPGEWISVENLEKHIRYNLLPVQVLHPGYASEKLYYTYEPDRSESRFYYSDKHYLDDENYYNALILPLIKGSFYLFAAFGLLDVAYDEVDTSSMGQTCYSPYDGLRYVRLNSLGAYVAGRAPAYEVPETIGQSSIVLSGDSLTIVADEQDATAPVLLEPYTERVSPNRYRTDHTFFLKDCRTKKELKDKINLFKESVSNELPPNWEAFFKELEGKIDPLDNVANVKVFKIPPDNKTLIQLIARDATLKKLCLKAEDYHILVPKNNLSRFKKRLQEFGYLLT
jgi:hypothetical protein